MTSCQTRETILTLFTTRQSMLLLQFQQQRLFMVQLLNHHLLRLVLLPKSKKIKRRGSMGRSSMGSALAVVPRLLLPSLLSIRSKIVVIANIFFHLAPLTWLSFDNKVNAAGLLINRFPVTGKIGNHIHKI